MTTAEARELCRSLFLETLDSLRVAPRMRSRMQVHDSVLKIGANSFPLSKFQSVRVIAFGKAAMEMAATAVGILASREQEIGARIRGIVVSPKLDGTQAQALSFDPRPASGFQYFQAGHPYPDEQSAQAAEAVLALLAKCNAGDLVLFLISGGGSALFEKSIDPDISPGDMRRFHELLVTSGANIQEINTLRKHFSAVKGGRLALHAAPATQITVYVSDVPEGADSAVASGPTMPDESTVADCLRIATEYGLIDKLPDSIRRLLESKRIPETPKPGDACFAQSRYHCLLSNRDGIEKLLELARAKGVRAEADTSCDDWPVERAADYLLGRLEALRKQHNEQPCMIVSGGEVSSPVPSGAEGRGGRNHAFVLDCVPKIAGQPVTVLSAGTDGIDGNSPAAGAIADGETAPRAASLGLAPEEFASRFDSYGFFERVGGTIATGATGTNVRDLRILLAYA